MELSHPPLKIDFTTEEGLPVPSISFSYFNSMITGLSEELNIQLDQLSEGAAYSEAMVVRHGLGSYAANGEILVLAHDCLYGLIALKTARHLLSAGAKITVVTPDSHGSAEYRSALTVLIKMGVVINFRDIQAEDLLSSHVLLAGMNPNGATTMLQETPQIINEHVTPVHSIGIPFGICKQTGARKGTIYSASTLSIGLPLDILKSNIECIGRHYLCDISATLWLKKHFSQELNYLFSEQPVIKII